MYCIITSSRSLSFTPGKPRRGLKHTSTRDLGGGWHFNANNISIDLTFSKCPLSPHQSSHLWNYTYQSIPGPVALHLDHRHCRLQLCLPEIGFASMKKKKEKASMPSKYHHLTEHDRAISSGYFPKWAKYRSQSCSHISLIIVNLHSSESSAFRQVSIINDDIILLWSNTSCKGQRFLTRGLLNLNDAMFSLHEP